MPFESALDTARDQATDFLNAEGRNLKHVALGVTLTAGFALAATVLASRAIPPQRLSLKHRVEGAGPVAEKPRGPLSLILPAVFSATTLSAVRVWNAPSRPERRNAMILWAAAQAVNAVWLAVRPAGRRAQIAAAMSSAGLAAAFAHEAGKLDPGAGKLASPIGGGVRAVNAVEREIDTRATVH